MKSKDLINLNIPRAIWFGNDNTNMPSTGAQSEWVQKTIDLTDLANGTAVVSEQVDLAPADNDTPIFGSLTSPVFNYFCKFQFNAAVTTTEIIKIYAAWALPGLNTVVTGDLGVSSAAVSTVAHLGNCPLIANVLTTKQDSTVAWGKFTAASRYMSIAVHNTGATIHTTNTAGDSYIVIWPENRMRFPA